MRNFYDNRKPSQKFFNGLFGGQQVKQLQSYDIQTDLKGCCCKCADPECKSCMEGHVISATAGCCHSKNNGLIFEYERPGYAGGGSQCCRNSIPCCPDGGEGAVEGVQFLP